MRSESDHPRVALVTGASRGIGAATARALARRGYALVLAARSADALADLSAELQREGCPTLVVPTDVRRAEDRERLVRTTLDHFGRVDVLINNAGVVNPGVVVADLSNDDVELLVDTNLLAPIALTRAILPGMIARRSGAIIFVASVGGHIGLPSAALYSTTKFGLRGFALALRREVARHNVTVAIISPGFLRTRLTEPVLEIFGRVPLPMGGPERAAAAIVAALARRVVR
jgi:short-subunit dehydrogenase